MSGQSALSRRLWLLLLVLVVLFIFRNMIFSDYSGETRSYLKKVGKDEVADYIVPKTYSELRKERMNKDVQFDMMWLNVTRLSATEEQHHLQKADMLATISKLQTEVQTMKSQLEQIKEHPKSQESATPVQPASKKSSSASVSAAGSMKKPTLDRSKSSSSKTSSEE
jgi:hypothetical protein